MIRLDNRTHCDYDTTESFSNCYRRVMKHKELKLVADTIRCLAADGVEKAKSGHPGMPMGTADFAAVLFTGVLKHCPVRPDWPDRDRFVVSAGHGSMLLYSLLHLAGYALPLSELQKFRQFGSLTAGHPEHGLTPGVETTTGPLSQGIGNAVGMALCERMLATRYNTTDFTPVDHHTYVICSDGDLMEGLSHEACALAGHLKLHKLIVFYDSNRITIEGATDLAYSDDVRRRFEGYHWNVLEIDGHDFDAIEKALQDARSEKERPTIIIGRTHIGQGSPNLHDTAKIHGAPLGEEELRATKRNLGFEADRSFYVPESVSALFASRRNQLEQQATDWDRRWSAYQAAHPDLATAWRAAMNLEVPADLDSLLPVFDPAKPLATRVASGKTIQALSQAIPSLVGGSADLAPSTNTLIDAVESIAPGRYAGRNLHFGIREHGMAALLNGMMLHGGFRAFGATFFVFSDYCRPSVRLSSIMKLPVIYVFTHDSFYVGEDGPTHQPVEHIAALRSMPGITVIRPSDATETAAAWAAALRNTTGPTALLLTRQNVGIIDRAIYPPATLLEKGAYTLWQNASGKPDLILIASGSEVELALTAAQSLTTEKTVRVVSMPSWELFEHQDAGYRESVLPSACRNRIAIEAGTSFGWERYVGDHGRVLGLDHFGESGPFKALAQAYGFTVEGLTAIIAAVLP